MIAISEEDYVVALRRLFSAGSTKPFPRRRKDQGVLLRALARSIAHPEPLSEREVTSRIARWLGTIGEVYHVDAVTLRRALCDEGFLERDAAGHAYTASRRFENAFAFEPGVASVDEEDVVEAAREAVRSAAAFHRVKIAGTSADRRTAGG